MAAITGDFQNLLTFVTTHKEKFEQSLARHTDALIRSPTTTSEERAALLALLMRIYPEDVICTVYAEFINNDK